MKWPECHPGLQGGRCSLCGRDHYTAVTLDSVDTEPMVVEDEWWKGDQKHHRKLGWPRDRRYRKQRRVCGDCLRVLVEKELQTRLIANAVWDVE